MIRKLLLLFALSAFAAAPAAQGATTVTLVFTSYTTITKTNDKPPRGKANAGDKIEFKDLLVTTSNQLGKKKGKPVGYDAGTVRYVVHTYLLPVLEGEDPRQIGACHRLMETSWSLRRDELRRPAERNVRGDRAAFRHLHRD